MLSAGDGIEKIQNVIEELILDDSLDSDFGGQLLSELDDVLDLRDANADDAETRDALAEVLDTLREGIENGEADSNAGRLVSGMIEGVINILLG